MKLAILIASLIWIIPVHAQELKTRDETVDYISRELAKINSLVSKLESGSIESMSSGYAEDLIDGAISRAMEMKQVLEDNPYARVNGVTIGIPWGISVEIEFR